MPHYTVKYNGKWAAYTTVANGFLTPFMPLSEYQRWRRERYGDHAGPVKKTSCKSLKEAVKLSFMEHPIWRVMDELVEAGVTHADALAVIKEVTAEELQDLEKGK